MYLHVYTENLPVYMNLPGVPLQNCLDLYDRVTSTTPGMCLGGVWTRMACGVINWRRKGTRISKKTVYLMRTKHFLQKDNGIGVWLVTKSLQSVKISCSVCLPADILSLGLL